MRYQTAQAAVAEMLRTEILQGRIPPRTRLLQNDIAERFETSTTPVREALRELVAEGLLDGDPHRGVVVHQTSLEELEELYEIRLALEPLMIRATVDAITEAEIDDARRLIDAMEGEHDPAAWTDLNAAFHSVLAGAARRPRLGAIIRNLRNLSALYIAASLQDVPERFEVANQEHADLLTAIREQDVASAEAITAVHLAHTLQLGKRHLAPTVEG